MFGEIVNKWQIICPLVAMAIVGVVFALVSGSNHHRYYLHAQTRMIGEELVAMRSEPGVRALVAILLLS